jgi:hypothetical protein
MILTNVGLTGYIRHTRTKQCGVAMVRARSKNEFEFLWRNDSSVELLLNDSDCFSERFLGWAVSGRLDGIST